MHAARGQRIGRLGGMGENGGGSLGMMNTSRPDTMELRSELKGVSGGPLAPIKYGNNRSSGEGFVL